MNNAELPMWLCERTCREEGWKPIGEATLDELVTQAPDMVADVFEHRKPEFFNTESSEFANADDWRALVEQQRLRVYPDSMAIPSGLSDEGKRLARAFRAFVAQFHGLGHITRHDCTMFRDPVSQGEFERVEVPKNAVLAIIYDGGWAAPMLNPAYESWGAFNAVQEFMDRQGYWTEPYTHWWCWVYRKEES